MSRVTTAELEGWRHDEIQGERVDINGLPFSDGFLSGSFPAVISHDAPADTERGPVPLGQISPFHGRSYEVDMGARSEDSGRYRGSRTDMPLGSFESPFEYFSRKDQYEERLLIATALWADSHGNYFTSLNTKGNNFTKPGVFRSATAPSGYIPFGVQEDDSLARVVKASRLMREAGVDTEWPVRVIQPQQMLFGEELVSQPEFTRRIAAQIMEKGEANISEAALAAAAIKHMNYFVTVRAMMIDERPLDFRNDNTPEAMEARLERIFAVHNFLVCNAKNYGETRQLDAQRTEDVDYYWGKLLPRRIGTNLAKLHDAGMVHTFPYLGNIHALGGLVDLDSVKGEPLGLRPELDRAVTIDDRTKDLFLMGSPDHLDDFLVVNKLRGAGLMSSPFLVDGFYDELLCAYVRARGLGLSVREGEDNLVTILFDYDLQPQGGLVEIIKDELLSLVGTEELPDISDFFNLDLDSSEFLERLKNDCFGSSSDNYGEGLDTIIDIPDFIRFIIDSNFEYQINMGVSIDSQGSRNSIFRYGAALAKRFICRSYAKWVLKTMVSDGKALRSIDEWASSYGFDGGDEELEGVFWAVVTLHNISQSKNLDEAIMPRINAAVRQYGHNGSTSIGDVHFTYNGEDASLASVFGGYRGKDFVRNGCHLKYIREVGLDKAFEVMRGLNHKNASFVFSDRQTENNLKRFFDEFGKDMKPWLQVSDGEFDYRNTMIPVGTQTINITSDSTYRLVVGCNISESDQPDIIAFFCNNPEEMRDKFLAAYGSEDGSGPEAIVYSVND